MKNLSRLTIFGVFSLLFLLLFVSQTKILPAQSASAGGTYFVYLPIIQRVAPLTTIDPNNWLEYVNYYRSIAGVPAVTEDTTLDNNCWEHARYMAENNDLTHVQDPNLPYASAAGQICAGNGNAWLGGAFFQPYWEVHHSIEGWMESVGHRLWLLYPTTPTFGYGFYTASNNRAGAALDVLSTFNSSADDGYSGWPIRYPAPNQTDVPAEAYPITINWKYFGATPTVSSTSLITFGGTNLAHTADTNLPVGHKGIEIFPSQPLPANTTILVSVSGSYDGTPFTYTWQFTTATTLSAPAGLEGTLNEAPTDH